VLIFFGLFFLHAELQDPQIEKHAKNNTKPGHSIKHILKQQTEVQFVVFAYLAVRARSAARASPRLLDIASSGCLPSCLRRGTTQFPST
jgi:hypothetical protein